MGKDTGGNRKQGRAGTGRGAGAAPQAAAGQELAGPAAADAARSWMQQEFGTTQPSKLFNENGLSVDVAVNGEITITSAGLTSPSVTNFSDGLRNHAKGMGLQLVATTSEISLPNGALQKFKLVGG